MNLRVLVLLALAVLANASQFGCKYVLGGKTYDVSSTYSSTGYSSGDFKYNLCGTHPECGDDVVACRTTANGQLNYGSAASRQHFISYDDDNNAEIGFLLSGDAYASCDPSLTTVIQFSCAASQSINAVLVQENCTYTILVQTPGACTDNAVDATSADESEGSMYSSGSESYEHSGSSSYESSEPSGSGSYEHSGSSSHDSSEPSGSGSYEHSESYSHDTGDTDSESNSTQSGSHDSSYESHEQGGSHDSSYESHEQGDSSYESHEQGGSHDSSYESHEQSGSHDSSYESHEQGGSHDSSYESHEQSGSHDSSYGSHDSSYEHESSSHETEPTGSPTSQPTAAPSTAPASASVTVSVSADVSQDFEGDQSQFDLNGYSKIVHSGVTASGTFPAGSIFTVTSSFAGSRKKAITRASGFTVKSQVSASITTNSFATFNTQDFKNDFSSSVTTAVNSPAVKIATATAFNATATGAATVSVNDVQSVATTYLWRQRFATSGCVDAGFAATTVQSGHCVGEVAYVYNSGSKTVDTLSCSGQQVSSVAAGLCFAVAGTQGIYEKWTVGQTSYFPYAGGAAKQFSYDKCKTTDAYLQYNPSACFPIVTNSSSGYLTASSYGTLKCESGVAVLYKYSDSSCKSNTDVSKSGSSCSAITNDYEGPHGSSFSFSCPAGNSPAQQQPEALRNSASTAAINVVMIAVFAIVAFF